MTARDHLMLRMKDCSTAHSRRLGVICLFCAETAIQQAMAETRERCADLADRRELFELSEAIRALELGG